MAILTLFLFITQVLFFSAAEAQLDPCNAKDYACTLSRVQTLYTTKLAPGDEDLGITSLDPMIMDDISYTVDGLQLNFSNIKIKGFGSGSILKAQYDLKNMKLHVTIYIPIARIESDYEACGKAFGVPMNGQGSMWFNSFGLEIDYEISFTLVKGANGECYTVFNNYNYVYDLKYGNGYYENINADNPDLALKLKKTISCRNKEFPLIYGEKVIDSICDSIYNNAKILAQSIPASSVLTILTCPCGN